MICCNPRPVYATIQKLAFLNETNTFNQQGCIKFICDSEDIYNVTKYFYFKYMLFFSPFN